MEKFSKAHGDFFDSIIELERDIESAVTAPSTRSILKATKILARPSKIPSAILAHEMFKTSASDIKEDIDPVDLKNFLVDNFGIDWLEWLPEVTDKTVFEYNINETISNKIQAIRICLTTDTPWLEWHIFENVGKAFNHQIPSFEVIQPLSVGECATTMDTMQRLLSDRTEDFSQEVLLYVAAIAKKENYTYLPEEMEIGKAGNELYRMIPDKDLSSKTRFTWKRLDGKDILNATLSEDSAVHMQLAKLALLKQFQSEFGI